MAMYSSTSKDAEGDGHGRAYQDAAGRKCPVSQYLLDHGSILAVSALEGETLVFDMKDGTALHACGLAEVVGFLEGILHGLSSRIGPQCS